MPDFLFLYSREGAIGKAQYTDRYIMAIQQNDFSPEADTKIRNIFNETREVGVVYPKLTHCYKEVEK